RSVHSIRCDGGVRNVRQPALLALPGMRAPASDEIQGEGLLSSLRPRAADGRLIVDGPKHRRVIGARTRERLRAGGVRRARHGLEYRAEIGASGNRQQESVCCRSNDTYRRRGLERAPAARLVLSIAGSAKSASGGAAAEQQPEDRRSAARVAAPDRELAEILRGL